ncbi:hypothetical protein D3C86_1189620 [compost metagenome]
MPEDFPAAFLTSILNLSGSNLAYSNKSTSEVDAVLESNGLKKEDLDSWTGFDMIFDFYRLKNADELAIPEIGRSRVKQYEIVCAALEKSNDEKLVLWAKIFLKTIKSEPANHFRIDLRNNKIDRINP